MARSTKLACALAALLLSSFSLLAAEDPTYAALRKSRPDGRTIAVTNFAFDRDVYHITLNGTLHLLAPVDGKTFGAVFTGQGTYTLTPASAAEKRQLAIYAGDNALTVLTDTFDGAVFFDASLQKEAEGQAGAAKSGTPSPDAAGAFEDYMKRQRKDFSTNVQLRVLEEMLNPNPSGQPFFLASLKSKKYGQAVMIVDPLPDAGSGNEQTNLVIIDKAKGGLWYSSHLKSEVAQGHGMVYPPLATADHYAIDTNIASNADVSGTTTMTIIPEAGLRVLDFNLMDKLRIASAELAPAAAAANWTPLVFIQEKADEDSQPAVIFAEPLKGDQKYLVRIKYSGKDVLFPAGDGNFSVGARESWYANVGVFTDPATYDLTYHTPAKLQLVSVGSPVSDTTAGDVRTSVWKTDPIRVAGFNYGKFKKLSQTDKDSGFTVDVYTNPGTPDIITDINRVLSAAASQRHGSDDLEDTYIGPDEVRIDTSKLSQSAMADGINTARTANFYFGPIKGNHVSITQQSQWSFGQSWPSLIYMPYIAFLDGTIRNTLGLNGARDFIDSVGSHEFAHQWWGHNVSGKSYHDEWISEGFAEFTAALVAQQTGGWAKYNNILEKKRRLILEKSRYSTMSNDQAGPISQGRRLATWQTPEAYDVIVYEKGAYVLHMLRMTMQESAKKNPDEAFAAMMTDFAQSYSGKNATTADFQHVVERHLTPTLKVTEDGKVDWFFNQWVYGTAIPKYTSKIEVTDAGGGKYHIVGNVTQSEVPNDFFVVMPLYVEFDKGSIVRLGNIGIVGNTTKPVDVEVALPRKPVRVTINAMHDVLAR